MYCVAPEIYGVLLAFSQWGQCLYENTFQQELNNCNFMKYQGDEFKSLLIFSKLQGFKFYNSDELIFIQGTFSLAGIKLQEFLKRNHSIQ